MRASITIWSRRQRASHESVQRPSSSADAENRLFEGAAERDSAEREAGTPSIGIQGTLSDPWGAAVGVAGAKEQGGAGAGAGASSPRPGVG